MCKRAIDKTSLASLLAVTLVIAGNSFLPFANNPSFAGEIAQTNEPERVPDGKMVPVNGKANVRLTNKTSAFSQIGRTVETAEESNDVRMVRGRSKSA